MSYDPAIPPLDIFHGVEKFLLYCKAKLFTITTIRDNIT
jgi:hypothetical protein